MTQLMKSTDAETLVLTPVQGSKLLRLLDEAIERLGSVDDTEALHTAYSKLDDARAIATWLRENVVVDVTADERLAMVEMLKEL